MPAGLLTTTLVLAACTLLPRAGVAQEAPLEGQWQLVTGEAAFSPRDTAEDVVFDGWMWLSNGYYHGNILTRDLWRSRDGVEWELVNDDTPYDGYSEMVAYNGKMWAIKGSAWTSTDGVEWTQVSEKTPFGVRGYGEVVIFRDRMWQLGSGRDVWHTADGVDWTCVTPNVVYGQRHASAVAVFKDQLWVMGGATSRENDPPEKGYAKLTTLNDVWTSTDGENWEQVLENAPWPPRMWHIPAVYAGRLWVIGGYDNRNARNLGDVWYTEDGVTWHEFESEPSFSPRHEVTPYVFDGSLWVVAGNEWPVKNDVWRLTLPAEEEKE